MCLHTSSQSLGMFTIYDEKNNSISAAHRILESVKQSCLPGVSNLEVLQSYGNMTWIIQTIGH